MLYEVITLLQGGLGQGPLLQRGQRLTGDGQLVGAVVERLSLTGGRLQLV